MLISNLDCSTRGSSRKLSASVIWEDRDLPKEQLIFAIGDVPEAETSTTAGTEPGWFTYSDIPSGDAFLAACFPLAAAHGECRVRVEGPACPMLIEGLQTAHAWWSSWGGMPSPAPRIETGRADYSTAECGRRRAVAFLSGGVDSLHLLMRNRRLYGRSDTAYIEDALFVHGFDIGKRRRNPENARYRAALHRLEPLAAEIGVRLIPCHTNLRHLPSRPGFWEHRHSSAGLAAIGHAAATGPTFAFLGSTFPLKNAIPWGSHPAVDGLFSSQRLTVVLDGLRFSRLEKVRELAHWPAALAALRPCPAAAVVGANCGHCEKCLRTRLELLAAGIDRTDALGASLTPIELWQEIPAADLTERASFYRDLLPFLRGRGYDCLCRVLEKKLAIAGQLLTARPLPACPCSDPGNLAGDVQTGSR